jgi:hypothetical protein
MTSFVCHSILNPCIKLSAASIRVIKKYVRGK